MSDTPQMLPVVQDAINREDRERHATELQAFMREIDEKFGAEGTDLDLYEATKMLPIFKRLLIGLSFAHKISKKYKLNLSQDAEKGTDIFATYTHPASAEEIDNAIGLEITEKVKF